MNNQTQFHPAFGMLFTAPTIQKGVEFGLGDKLAKMACDTLTNHCTIDIAPPRAFKEARKGLFSLLKKTKTVYSDWILTATSNEKRLEQMNNNKFVEIKRFSANTKLREILNFLTPTELEEMLVDGNIRKRVNIKRHGAFD